jgi:hypothetical protein
MQLTNHEGRGAAAGPRQRLRTAPYPAQPAKTFFWPRLLDLSFQRVLISDPRLLRGRLVRGNTFFSPEF